MSKKIAWLVDSNIYVYEAWNYCKEQGVDQQNRDIHGVIGFFNFLYKLLLQERPRPIAFAFDEKLKNSHRKALYPDYKKSRKPMSDDLALQFYYVRQLLEAMGFYQASSHHFEADDLIGSWAGQLRQEGYSLRFITADKDLIQLIQNDDLWWSYQHNYQQSVKSYRKRYRIYPHQMRDQLALAGDKSDDIPGVPGVGMSTAAKLLRKFGDIDNLLNNKLKIEQVQLRYAKQIQQAVIEHEKKIGLSRQLVEIKTDLAEVNLDDLLKQRHPDWQQFNLICDQLQFTLVFREQWQQLINKRQSNFSTQ